MKYIYHHLGLGDHIICNGLVRTLIKPDEKYIMFVKPHNLFTVKFMYRDLINLDFIVGDDNFAQNFIKNNKISISDLILAGFNFNYGCNHFDESFYIQNNVSFNNRWDNFYIERDKEREYSLFKKYGLEENEYVFIHDDLSRNFTIDESLIINKELKIVRPIIGLTNNIFDYCYLMEKSRESHFIDSSFRLVFDSLLLRNDLIFYHLKMKNNIYRNTNKFNNSQSKLNFTIFD